MSALVAGTDWSSHPMGPAAEWPLAFRTALETVLATAAPGLVVWGPELCAFYNEALARTLGDRHPTALGLGVERIWPDASPMHGLVTALRAGRACHVEAALGGGQSARVACTPVLDDAAGARGMLCVWLPSPEARAHAATEQTLGQLLHTVAEAVVVVRDDVVFYANAQAHETFGYAPGELVGMPYLRLVPERARSMHQIAPSGDPATTQSMNARDDLSALRKDGTEFPVEISMTAVPTPQGTMISTVVRDVTEKRQLAALGQRHASRLIAAIESTPHPFFVVDEQDRLIGANAMARANLVAAGGDPDRTRTGAELMAAMARVRVFDDEDERARFEAARRAAAGNDTDSFDIRWADGRSFRVTRQNVPGGGYAMIGLELTEENRRAKELELARAQADAASRSKSEFLASMSHELRTPLNAVLGFAQLLLRDKRETLSERQRGMVERVHQAGEHLLRLVDDVLDLARIEARGIGFSPAPVARAGLVEQVVASLGETARRAGVQILPTSVPQDLPMVDTDRVRLAQVLMNFGTNAIKYNRRGGWIAMALAPSERSVRVSVSDSGIGIAPEHRGRLFESFQRGAQQAGPIEGTGIGLAISKRIAELMGGSVGYRPLAEGGSEFWVELPVHASGARTGRPPSPSSGAAPREVPLPRMRVLYVEDNAANVDLVRQAVASLDGVDFFAAPSAESGLVLAREMRPEVILMDINLPGMNGYQALAALRAAPETSAIPVIAVSAAALPHDRERGMRAGFTTYLTKPLGLDELETALRTALQPRSA